MAPKKSSAKTAPKTPSKKGVKAKASEPAWHKSLMEKRWLRGGILGLILALLGGVAIFLAYELWKPPSLAELLPAGDTVAFIEMDLDRYTTLTEEAPENFKWSASELECMFAGSLFETNCERSEWRGRHVGLAWVRGEEGETRLWFFMEVSDEAAAESYSATLNNDETTAYFSRGYLVVGPQDETADKLKEVESGQRLSLKQDEHFATLRPHLSYQSTVFGYIKPPLVGDDELSEWWMPEDLVTTIMLQALASNRFVAPAFGFTLDEADQGLMMQTHLLLDKSLTGEQPIFDLNEKYKGDLLEILPGEVGEVIAGQDLAKTLDQLGDFLNATDGVSGLILEGALEEKIQGYLGEEVTLESTFYPLFSEEYVIAYVLETVCDAVQSEIPQEPVLCEDTYHPMLGVELTDETALLVESLNETILSRGLFEITDDTLYQITLEMVSEEQRDLKYNVIQREDGQDWVQFMVYDEVLWVTWRKADMKSLINTILDGESDFDRQAVEAVDGAAHHVTSFPIDTVTGLDRVTTGWQLFDDGVATWSVLHFETL